MFFKIFNTDVYLTSLKPELESRNREKVQISDIISDMRDIILRDGATFVVVFDDNISANVKFSDISIDILEHPEKYIVDACKEYEFCQIEDSKCEGGIIRFSIGLNDEGEYYLLSEDDKYQEEYFIGKDGSCFEEIFYDIIENILLGYRMFI